MTTDNHDNDGHTAAEELGAHTMAFMAYREAGYDELARGVPWWVWAMGTVAATLALAVWINRVWPLLVLLVVLLAVQVWAGRRQRWAEG